MDLLVRVKSTTFDVQAGQLQVAGQIAEETQYARLGQHHTLDLELHRNFTLEKAEGWDSISLQIVKEACDIKKGASAWAVVMEPGTANIAILMGERTVLRQRVSVPVPGKRDGNAHAKVCTQPFLLRTKVAPLLIVYQAMNKFFQTTLDTLLRHIDLNDSLPILLASPGYTASLFQKFIQDYAVQSGNKPLQSQKQNFLVVHSPTGQLHSLAQVLQSTEVTNRLKDTKYARETKLIDTFFDLMRKDEGKAWYGPKEVERAVEQGAVGRGGGVLLISNALFRAQDVAIRRRWVTLVDRVQKKEGGEVKVLSSEHESGKRLDSLGGIAAILTFPLFDLDEDQDEEDGAGEAADATSTTNGTPA